MGDLMKTKIEVFFDKDNIEFLAEHSKELDMNMSQTVNRIVTEYRRISIIEDEIKRYRHDTEIERNVKILVELANTYLYQIQDSIYIPTSQLMHPTLEKADKSVRKDLAKKKQRKDNRRK